MGGDIQGPTNTGGVVAMPIAGRMEREIERMRGLTPEERAWRRKFLQDQLLMPDEPRIVPELRRELYNPMRRFYQMPLNALGAKLVPVVGEFRAGLIRSLIPKFFFCIAAVYVGAYYFKYNSSDWTTYSGWTVHISRTKSVPGDPDYPRLSDRKHPWDYADHGFKSRKVFLD